VEKEDKDEEEEDGEEDGPLLRSETFQH